MSMKRKSIFGKLMKLVGRGKDRPGVSGDTKLAKRAPTAGQSFRDQVQSTKVCLAQIYEERKKQRQRTSLSSQFSHIEPMPTIQEEDEFVYEECHV